MHTLQEQADVAPQLKMHFATIKTKLKVNNPKNKLQK